MKGILLATNIGVLGEKISKFDGYNVVGNADTKENIIPMLIKMNPDILFLTEGIASSKNTDTIPLLISITQRFPALRIIYLAGSVDLSDTLRIKYLGELVQAGIYDVVHDGKISPRQIKDILDNPKSLEDVSYLMRHQHTTLNNSPEIMTQEFDAEADICKNIIIFSSIKPGSGKSFLSVNVGAAIAKYGKRKKDGTMPTVAIIEGDLQTLSVGTLLKIEDETYNLKSALNKVSEVIDETGDFIADESKIEEVQAFVRRCFIQYNDQPNLFALVGSQMSLGDLNKINSYQYFYLVQLMSEQFDVIIVDTNSSLEHKTTGPLLQLANTCYYVLDLDFNNIRNNMRYRQELDSLGVYSKVRYILNRDIPPTVEGAFAESLSYNANDLNASGFDLVAKVPMVDITVMYNRVYRGTPIILDKTQATFEARKEMFKIADQIWALDVLTDLKMESAQYAKAKKKRFLFF